MRAVGIDFGTSHTVAVVAVDGAPARPLLFDGSPLLPSAVYLDPGGRLVAGQDAVRAARLDPARFEPNPKRRVDEGTVLLGSTSVAVSALVGAVLARVAEEARRWAGEAYSVVLTHPAGWSSVRCEVLVAAAQSAGLPGTPALLPEPVAAARYFTAVLRGSMPPGSALAVYDLGGGTFDAAVVRRSPTGFEVLSAHGLSDVGGLDLDQALVEHLGAAYSPSRTAVWNALLTPEDTAHRRQRALLYDDVRGTKEALSRTSSADVHVPGLEVAAHVTRDELEALARPMLARTVECLGRTIADARLAEEDLVGVFLVGGSSRMPLVARMIHQELGIAPTALEQPETVVAQGAVSLEPAPPGHRVPAQRRPVTPQTTVLPPPGGPGYPTPANPMAGPGYPAPASPAGGPGYPAPARPMAGPGYPAPANPVGGLAYPSPASPAGGLGYPVPSSPAAGSGFPAPSSPAGGQAYPAPASPAAGYAVPAQRDRAARTMSTTGRAGLAWVVVLSVLVVVAAAVLVVLLAGG